MRLHFQDGPISAPSRRHKVRPMLAAVRRVFSRDQEAANMGASQSVELSPELLELLQMLIGNDAMTEDDIVGALQHWLTQKPAALRQHLLPQQDDDDEAYEPQIQDDGTVTSARAKLSRTLDRQYRPLIRDIQKRNEQFWRKPS